MMKLFYISLNNIGGSFDLFARCETKDEAILIWREYYDMQMLPFVWEINGKTKGALRWNDKAGASLV